MLTPSVNVNAATLAEQLGPGYTVTGQVDPTGTSYVAGQPIRVSSGNDPEDTALSAALGAMGVAHGPSVGL